eukprot:gene45798-62012_t
MVHCTARAADIVGTNRAINLPAQMATPDHERMVGFCRVIEGFMAQTGDPKGTGQGGSELPDLKAEINRTPHLRGTVSMARTNEPDT